MGRQGGRQNQDGLTEKQPCMPLLSLQTLKPRQPEGKASLCKPAMPLILRATPSLASFFRERLAVLTALIEPFVLIVIYLSIYLFCGTWCMCVLGVVGMSVAAICLKQNIQEEV